MITISPDSDVLSDSRNLTSDASDMLPLSFHPTFHSVSKKIKKWLKRISRALDESVFTDLYLMYLLASKKFLNHRNPSHLFRLVISVHLMQKKLQHSATFSPHRRHLEIRWIPAALLFPFSSKPVLGCLIGFNVKDRYELFDEENMLLALQKYMPDLRLVKESSYNHISPQKNIKIFYLEIEKKNGQRFSLREKILLKNSLEDKVKNSIQTLSPSIYMGHNEEETYKNIQMLSQEINSLDDLPQVYITLYQQTKKEIIFRITLVHITPFHRFSLRERFFECHFVSQRHLTVRHLDDHPIEAHVFCLHLPREASFLRSDGSLDFYCARQKIVSLLNTALGEFRDYNGGILLKQQELLQSFKDLFPDLTDHNSELLESFFYVLTPLDHQVCLQPKTLATLFNYYLTNRKDKLAKGSAYNLNIYPEEGKIYLVIRGDSASLRETVSTVIHEHHFRTHEMAYAMVDNHEAWFFSCVLNVDSRLTESFIQSLKQSLYQWQKKVKNQQVLRIGLEFALISLDPRIGADAITGQLLKFLFEGLTRFNHNGQIENAVAESITISPNMKEYVFKLKHTLWNDGSPVTAFDFEYAWKKILSPDFKTAFAYMFEPIKNAKEAKEGKVSLDQVGIHVINDRTLKIELNHPTPYFLQLIAHSLYSPINRFIDQQHPQWPYQSEVNYPCNGPFQLKINQPEQGYQLIKNPFYSHVNQIVLDQITFTMMSSQQAFQAYQKGDLDWIGNPFGSWHQFYKPRKENNIVTFPNSWVVWCTFNTAAPPFHHPKIRQAFAYVIDRSEIVSSAFLPITPAYSPLPVHYFENNSHRFPEKDLEKANQLLDEALSELGINKKDLPVVSLVFTEKGIRENAAVCLQKQFKEGLGIECELTPLPWNKFFYQMSHGNHHMGIMHWSSWVNDPIYTLNLFRNTHEGNYTKWEHLEFQRFLELSEQEVNPFQRSSYLRKAEEILSREMPVIPLFHQSYQALVTPDLQICDKNTCGYLNLTKSFYKTREVL
ncbi:MAG: peptide ABC transporter substrate-binding protein [Parachlamydiaceae bacterium]